MKARDIERVEKLAVELHAMLTLVMCLRKSGHVTFKDDNRGVADILLSIDKALVKGQKWLDGDPFADPFVDPFAPRVITRVMDDGIKTKDGAA